MHMQTNMQQFWSLQRGFLPQFLQFFGVLSVFWPCTKIYTFIIQRRENGPSFDVKLQQRLLDVLFQSWRSLPLNTEIKKSQRLWCPQFVHSSWNCFSVGKWGSKLVHVFHSSNCTLSGIKCQNPQMSMGKGCTKFRLLWSWAQCWCQDETLWSTSDHSLAPEVSRRYWRGLLSSHNPPNWQFSTFWNKEFVQANFPEVMDFWTQDMKSCVHTVTY